MDTLVKSFLEKRALPSISLNEPLHNAIVWQCRRTAPFCEAMKKQGKMAGATGWLVKPFGPQKLLEIMKKVAG